MVVVGWAGFGWLRDEIFLLIVGSPPFVGLRNGHTGQPVPCVGEN